MDQTNMQNTQKNSYRTAHLFGLSIFGSNQSELLKLFKKSYKSESDLLSVATPNPEQIMLSRRNPVFLDHLRSFSIRVADGIGLVLASKLLSTQPISERITGVASVELLLSCLPEGRPALLVGGRGYANAVVQCNTSGSEKRQEWRILPVPLTTKPFKNPPLQPKEKRATAKSTLYWTEAYKDISAPTLEEESRLGEIIQDLKPAVVFVALGAPFQEAWVVRHMPLLRKHDVRIVITVGGAFDMLTGKLKRAPGFLRAVGLEWLFRLIQEPWRWRRQLSLLSFCWLVFATLLKKPKMA